MLYLRNKRDKHPKKMTKKKLKEVNNTEKGNNMTYDTDMTIYEKYLHLLLIKTSDKFIQDRYKDFLARINKGKEKKGNFFTRMQEDIKEREESKKEREDTLSENSSIFR
jgi:hypothetical protein